MVTIIVSECQYFSLQSVFLSAFAFSKFISGKRKSIHLFVIHYNTRVRHSDFAYVPLPRQSYSMYRRENEV